MIAQVQTEAPSSPIITSLTTKPACQNSAQIGQLHAGLGESVDFPSSTVLKEFRAVGSRLAPGASVSVRTGSAKRPDIAQKCAVAAFSGQMLVKRRRRNPSQFSPISSWTVMVNDQLGFAARRSRPTPIRAAGRPRPTPRGKRRGRPLGAIMATSTLPSTSTSSPRRRCAAPCMMRAPPSFVGARLDGQDVVDPRRPQEVDLHVPDHKAIARPGCRRPVRR